MLGSDLATVVPPPPICPRGRHPGAVASLATLKNSKFLVDSVRYKHYIPGMTQRTTHIPGLPDAYQGPGIYTLTDPDTGHLYVGSSTNIRSRLSQHRTKPRLGHIGWPQKAMPCPRLDEQSLRAAEANTIREAQMAGKTVTNVIFAGHVEYGPAPKKSHRRMYEHGGVAAPLTFWMVAFGCLLRLETVMTRINRAGMTVEEACTTPLKK